MKVVLTITLLAATLLACTRPKVSPSTRGSDVGGDSLSLHGLCESMTRPRIETVAPGVHVAIGFDLANTVLIETSAGHVVVDAGMSPVTAAATKAALLAKAPGKIAALIYTHSHLDHVGGASAWIEPSTEIWASSAFVAQFFKQYGLFQPIEQIRAGRQYGANVPRELLPCTGIGPLPDLVHAVQSGARMPTRSFARERVLTIGGVRLELREAYGETQDQILIWLPDRKVAIAGDNIYRAFPNLYTIRGTSPRPVDQWIASLDVIRRLEPEVLIPGHTEPIVSRARVAETVTAYRDAIQWVRDATVRGANAGESATSIAERLRLPPHLLSHPHLQETYGQVDWSARAIYDNELGWFAGEAAALYPMARREAATREVKMMGGPNKVLAAAKKALKAGDAKWAVHLLSKMRDVGLSETKWETEASATLAKALEALAAQTGNTNGRGYLAESAHELRTPPAARNAPHPDPELLRQVPLATFFRTMMIRLRADAALDVHESLRFHFTDFDTSYTITVRHGIAEVVQGEPLPGTPNPVGTIRLTSMTWKQLGVRDLAVATALASGQIAVDGDWVAVARFLSRFDVD